MLTNRVHYFNIIIVSDKLGTKYCRKEDYITMVNTPYLEDKIKLSGKTKTFLADKCGLTNQGFYNKLKGIRPFTESEATILCDELSITTLAERKKIFLPDM